MYVLRKAPVEDIDACAWVMTAHETKETGMSNHEAADTIREMMNQYDRAKAEWIEAFETADGFDAWFTGQALPDWPVFGRRLDTHL